MQRAFLHREIPSLGMTVMTVRDHLSAWAVFAGMMALLVAFSLMAQGMSVDATQTAAIAAHDDHRGAVLPSRPGWTPSHRLTGVPAPRGDTGRFTEIEAGGSDDPRPPADDDSAASI